MANPDAALSKRTFFDSRGIRRVIVDAVATAPGFPPRPEKSVYPHSRAPHDRISWSLVPAGLFTWRKGQEIGLRVRASLQVGLGIGAGLPSVI